MNTTYILYQSITNNKNNKTNTSHWTYNNLHDAIKDLNATRTAHVDGVEYTLAQWNSWNSTLLLTVQNATKFRTNYREERTLALFPITHSSARRLAALLNCEWQA